ncbi:hypothetical protein B0H16DRAFT_151059 [Mycena metata]|uniref:Uncharacterized protein n=1 Tax=Mycena metata TaxID=1033252 RepID=A0AAD7I490_9AGAR|nr:hypothetical protein B0H16DRAFT_151059 [Mycena metata]
MSVFAAMPGALLCPHRCPYPPRRALLRFYSASVVAAAKTMEESCTSLPLGSAVLPPRPREGPPPYYAPRTVSTLNPAHITAADWVTIPSAQEIYLRFTRSNVKHKSPFGYNPPLRNIPFPKGISGFLYYYVPPDPSPVRALLQSGIRLRLAPEPNPELFATGTDLLDPIGFPWHIPVWQFVCPRGMTFPDVFSHLHAEGLISTAKIAQVRASVRGVVDPAVHAPHPTLALFHGGQEFPIRFEDSVLKGVHIMCDDDGILRPLKFALSPLYASPWMKTVKPFHPWQGVARARFERSADPAHLASGKRFLRMRLTKMIVPPTLVDALDDGTPDSDLLRPAEGALVVTGDPNEPNQHRVKVWEVFVDEPERQRCGRAVANANQRAALEALWMMSA